jgi:hypothetical protein
MSTPMPAAPPPLLHVEVDPAEPAAGRTRRARTGLLAALIVVATLPDLPGAYLYPDTASGDTWYRYVDVAPIREFWWGLNILLAVNLILAVPATALAAVILTPRRGAIWTTVGGALMWVGTALYAVGVGGLAVFYYFATDPAALDPGVAAGFVERFGSGWKLYATAIPGALLVAFGTVVMAIGLWRSRSVPRWLPVLLLVSSSTFFVDLSGVLKVVVQLPACAAALALAYYLWRRA